eukprot:6748127-Alexandrium_andersonii.AAC.1
MSARPQPVFAPATSGSSGSRRARVLRAAARGVAFGCARSEPGRGCGRPLPSQRRCPPALRGPAPRRA